MFLATFNSYTKSSKVLTYFYNTIMYDWTAVWSSPYYIYQTDIFDEDLLNYIIKELCGWMAVWSSPYYIIKQIPTYLFTVWFDGYFIFYQRYLLTVWLNRCVMKPYYIIKQILTSNLLCDSTAMWVFYYII